MEEPIGSIFAIIGESVKLGVSVEKALTDTAKKLKTTEFNFFVTSIILQRETGGNLSEILSNLSDVLRKRFMMRMKIKAMASEAKASAIIVGALPFVVILALMFVSPGYLDPLMFDSRGHVAAGIAAAMMATGIGVMIKMTKFEI
jgi:tight adherence protein B